MKKRIREKKGGSYPISLLICKRSVPQPKGQKAIPSRQRGEKIDPKSVAKNNCRLYALASGCKITKKKDIERKKKQKKERSQKESKSRKPRRKES